MDKYTGITYPKIFQFSFVHKLWRRFMCTKGKHLLDEVWSPNGDDTTHHYLSCDACNFEIGIEYVSEKWVYE